jgi:hypothetical protein
MATAAHLARLGMKSVREWMELDELKKSTLASYLPKAATAAAQSVYTGKEAQAWAGHHMRAGEYKASDAQLATSKKELGKSVRRLKGVEMATKKLAKENFHPLVAKHFAIEMYSEEELREMDQLQIDELKSTTLQSYADKAHQQAMDATYDAAHLNRTGEEKLKANAKAVASKRAGGVQLAQSKLDKRNEGVDYKGMGTDVVDKKKKLNPQPNLMSDKKTVKDFKEETITEGKMKEIYTDMMDHATKKGYSSHKQFTPADYDAVGKQHNISGKDLAVALGHKTAAQVTKEEVQEIYYDSMDLFLEALMSPEVMGRVAGHEKAGNKVSDHTSRMKNGEMEYSFVVTQPSGKRSRHIYHGNKTRHETMSPAPKSKEAHETGEDDEDK